MKLYNPFKIHIVKFKDGTYAIRQFNTFVLRWAYLDTQKDFWWTTLKNKQYFVIDTLENAHTLLFQHNFLLRNSLIEEETEIDTDYGTAI